MVRVRFLGSGDAFGSGGRFQTCILVEGERSRFLLDCGPSSLIAMRRFGVDPNGIDAILLTHLHGDHYAGVPFLLLDAQAASRRERPLVVTGPPGTGERLRATAELLFPGSSTLQWRFALEVRELEPGRCHRVGALEVTPYLMAHESGAPSTGLRVGCEGRTIAYTGDTEWNENIVPLARDADLLIGESYQYDRPVPHHMSYRLWLEHLPALAPRRFVATHMGARVLAHLGELECETAEDGMVLEV